MSSELKKKILKIAAQICWLHGDIAGNRSCQDWSGQARFLDALTPEERDQLASQYEDFNNQGDEFDPGYFPYDEMLISFIIARALDVMAGGL